MEKNCILELEVVAVSGEGFGICKYNGGSYHDFVVYVPFTAIGDVAEVRIVKKLSSYAFGKVERLISPSPARVEPDCPSFEKCGGCTFRHLSYPEELRYKRETVISAYRRAFGRDNGISVADTVPSPKEEFYRNKVQFPIDREGKCAFYAQRSHRTVDVSGCRLQNTAFRPAVEAFERYVRENRVSVYDEESGKGLLRHFYLRYGEESGEVLCCIVANGKKLPNEQALIEALSSAKDVCGAVLSVNEKNTNVILGEEFRTLFGKDRVSDLLCGVGVEISCQSFYQVNKKQAEAIYEKACELACVSGKERVLDLYCGIGGISFGASSKAQEVLGVEIVPEAVEDAKRAAAKAGISNVRFCVSDASRLSRVLAEEAFTPHSVIVDPPRKGLDDATVDAITEILPERLVYVSCNPETQARNLRDIIEKAAKRGVSYTVGEVLPYDMFPRTAHVETVVLLSREKPCEP